MAHDQFERALAAPQAIGWRARLLAVRHRLEMACARFDPIHDLAEDIGSLHWFRGLGTMCALGFVALACWPDFTALEAATTTPPDAAIRDELRSQMIMPLGQGGESGRRWGANPRLVSAITTAPERPRIALTATLGTGDPFSRMLQRAGVGPDDAARASSLIAGTIPPSSIEPEITVSRISTPARTAAAAPIAVSIQTRRSRERQAA